MSDVSLRKELAGLLKRKQSFLKGTHAGLWLDKYLRSSDPGDTEAKRQLVEELAEINPPKEYGAYLERYLQTLRDLGAQIRLGEVQGRMVIGLGGESILETHLTLHRTYGVPYLPGSALKGLASRFAASYIEGDAWGRRLDPRSFQRGEAQQVLFGTTKTSGIIVFYDGLPKAYELLPDVMTPHHSDYYGGSEVPPRRLG
jgi:CRISPR-associated protein Cmr6